jgi:hypothetical protein
MPRCVKCGNQVNPTDAFCDKCGQRIVPGATVPGIASAVEDALTIQAEPPPAQQRDERVANEEQTGAHQPGTDAASTQQANANTLGVQQATATPANVQHADVVSTDVQEGSTLQDAQDISELPEYLHRMPSQAPHTARGAPAEELPTVAEASPYSDHSAPDIGVCPSCGCALEEEGQLYCGQCGAAISPTEASARSRRAFEIAYAPTPQPEWISLQPPLKEEPSVPAAGPALSRQTPAARRACLVIAQAGVRIPIYADASGVTVGRSDPVNQVFPQVDLHPYGAEDAGVSRLHCKIACEGAQYVLLDTNSSNGTYLNGQRLISDSPHPLQNGDEIYLGQFLLRFMVD